MKSVAIATWHRECRHGVWYQTFHICREMNLNDLENILCCPLAFLLSHSYVCIQEKSLLYRETTMNSTLWLLKARLSIQILITWLGSLFFSLNLRRWREKSVCICKFAYSSVTLRSVWYESVTVFFFTVLYSIHFDICTHGENLIEYNGQPNKSEDGLENIAAQKIDQWSKIFFHTCELR